MHPIYLHGLGQTPASWENLMARLDLADCCLCLDLAELGRKGQAAYQDLYSGFSKICSKLDEPVDLCGLSLGGVLALQYAIEHPEKVNSLVLIAPQYKMPAGLLKFQNILFHLMPGSSFQSTGFGKSSFIRLCQTMTELDFSQSLDKISCPVLIVCGGRDFANKKASVKLAGLLKNAQLEIIHGSGHEVNIEAPEELAEVLQGFYRQVH